MLKDGENSGLIADGGGESLVGSGEGLATRGLPGPNLTPLGAAVEAEAVESFTLRRALMRLHSWDLPLVWYLWLVEMDLCLQAARFSESFMELSLARMVVKNPRSEWGRRFAHLLNPMILKPSRIICLTVSLPIS